MPVRNPQGMQHGGVDVRNLDLFFLFDLVFLRERKEGEAKSSCAELCAGGR
jgi:hypothetical protein